MLELKTEEKNENKTQEYLKMPVLSPQGKALRFRLALEEVILREMRESPHRFHKIVLNDASYPEKFSKHIMEKLQEGKILVMNETVMNAAKSIDIASGIDDLYRYFDFDPPKPIQKPEEPQEAPPRFRGC